MYSEQIYAGFAHQLRLGSGPVSVGQALLRSKQAYLQDTPSLRGIDTKALLEATLFGLPMLSVDLPTAGRIADPNDPSAVTASPVVGRIRLGLQSAPLTVTNVADPLAVHTKTLKGVPPAADTTATWYSGTAGVTSKPFEPALPLVNKNVSVPGTTLRGVGFVGGTYTDSSVVPLTGAAVEDIRGVHAVFGSPVFYPMRIAIANYFDALTSAAGTTRLLVTPAQHVYSGSGIDLDPPPVQQHPVQAVLQQQLPSPRRSMASTSEPGLAGPPSILDIHSAQTAPSTIAVDTHVVGDPSAGMQEVWVTYTGFDNHWYSAYLTKDRADSTHWIGTIPVPAGHTASEARLMLQAVNGVGLVAVDDNFGAYHTVPPLNTGSQTITFASISDATILDPDFTISPTSTAGLPVALSTSGPCTVSPATSPATVHITGLGICDITASAAGNATVTAAPPVTRSFTISKANQTITFAALAGKTFGDGDFNVAATSSSGLTVSFGASGACTVTGTLVHITGAGSCTITASQAGNGTYEAAPSVPRTFTVAKAGQTITFGTVPTTKVLGDADFPVTASATSGLPVTFDRLRLLHVTGTSVHLAAIGTCTITANQAGNGNYNPAPQVTAGIQVIWPFTGFSSPVDNLPTVNKANAGQAIPIKFSLGGDRGLDIFKPGCPRRSPCPATSAPRR